MVLLLANDAGVRAVPLLTSGSLTVGRGREADIRVNDSGVSRLHLRIHISPALRIEDTGSANGTCLRGERIAAGTSHPIGPGDAIEIGGTLMIVRRQTAQRAPEHAAAAEQPEMGEEMAAVLKRADRAARSDVAVLLLGETGVGKDVLAERIHHHSPRARGPFLRLNCASFSASVLESELFGHQKGAFTGATGARPGLLQSAEGGTVLLDEIGELPLELQAKLLLVVERREVLPVGADRPRRIDVRFIAATNRDLPRRVEERLFREDLYYRLNGVPITIPPLRRRLTEIEGLARCFVQEAARSIQQPVPAISSEVLELFRKYSWPGNIRELRTTLERAIVLGDGGMIEARDVSEFLHVLPPEGGLSALPTDAPQPERERIQAALAACGGNQSRAAKMLGVSRNTLIARLQKYNVARPLQPRRRG